MADALAAGLDASDDLTHRLARFPQTAGPKGLVHYLVLQMMQKGNLTEGAVKG